MLMSVLVKNVLLSIEAPGIHVDRAPFVSFVMVRSCVLRPSSPVLMIAIVVVSLVKLSNLSALFIAATVIPQRQPAMTSTPDADRLNSVGHAMAVETLFCPIVHSQVVLVFFHRT